MVSCQWLQESSKNQQQQHFIWPRKLAREGKDHLPGVLFASKQGQRNVFLVFIVYAQQPVVKKTGVGFERWLAVGPRRQLDCSFVFVLVYLCLHLVVYLYLWQIFCIRLFVFLCFFVFERQLAVGNSRQPGCGQKRMPQMSLRKKKKWSIDNRVITFACVPIVPTVPIWKIWLALVAQIGIWIYQCRRMWKWSFWFHIISSEVDVRAVAIDHRWFPTRKL